MSDELKISVNIEFKDFLNFQYWINRKRFFRPFIYIVFLIFFICIVSYVTMGSFDFSLFSGATLTPIILLLSLPLFIRASIYFNSKKMFESDSSLQKEQHFVFDSTGFTAMNENSTTIIKWEDVFKQIDSPKNLLIYCSSVKAFIIPKRLLSETELIDLKLLLASHVASKEKKTFFTSERIIRFTILFIAIGVGIVSGLSGLKNDPSNYFNDGNTKLTRGDFKGAIIDFDHAIKENPSYSMAYACKGYANEMLHNYSEAIDNCNKAIELDDKNYQTYYYMGYAKYQSGDSIGGCNDCKRVAALGSKDAMKAIESYCK